MQNHIIATRPQRVTYLGQRAEVFTIARSKNAAQKHGERISVVHWIDDAIGQPTEHPAGTIVARHIKGDGRKRDEFQQFDESVVTDPMAYAITRLT